MQIRCIGYYCGDSYSLLNWKEPTVGRQNYEHSGDFFQTSAHTIRHQVMKRLLLCLDPQTWSS